MSEDDGEEGYKRLYLIARVKKPHRKFAVGDIVIGEIVDGQAERIVCCGWSSKLRVCISAYSLRYQGWLPYRHGRPSTRTGAGHLQVIGEIESRRELPDEFSTAKSRADFIRQLRLFGGNVPGLVEAAATHHMEEP